jgi:hypothetical protein
MRFNYIAHLILTAATIYIADPVSPKTDPIRLPVIPAPAPLPAPSAIASLGADQLYVIDSDVSCIVLASPAGVVSVSEDVGPVKIRGKFVDGSGKVESRNYRGKLVYTIEPLSNGRVELLVIPSGGTQADVIRRTLDVGSGQGPQPPPNPQPNPEPSPSPVALWGFVVIEETGDAVAMRGAMLSDSTLAATIKSKGYHWRIVDKDVVGADGKPPADVLPCLNAAQGKTLPQVFLIDTKGNIATQAALSNAAGLVELLKKWGK